MCARVRIFLKEMDFLGDWAGGANQMGWEILCALRDQVRVGFLAYTSRNGHIWATWMLPINTCFSQFEEALQEQITLRMMDFWRFVEFVIFSTIRRFVHFLEFTQILGIVDSATVRSTIREIAQDLEVPRESRISLDLPGNIPNMRFSLQPEEHSWDPSAKQCNYVQFLGIH